MHKGKLKLANKDQSAAKEQEVTLVKMKCRSHAGGVKEGHGNVDAISKTTSTARRIQSSHRKKYYKKVVISQRKWFQQEISH